MHKFQWVSIWPNWRFRTFRNFSNFGSHRMIERSSPLACALSCAHFARKDGTCNSFFLQGKTRNALDAESRWYFSSRWNLSDGQAHPSRGVAGSWSWDHGWVWLGRAAADVLPNWLPLHTHTMLLPKLFYCYSDGWSHSPHLSFRDALGELPCHRT